LRKIAPDFGSSTRHIRRCISRICAGGCNAVDGPKDHQDVELFIAEALSMWEFIIVFLIALVVFIFFFVVMSFRKTSADSAHSTGHSCGNHHCHCTENRIKGIGKN
jgi:heme/copper-type cytochrome/quinol oxidase subunit 2